MRKLSWTLLAGFAACVVFPVRAADLTVQSRMEPTRWTVSYDGKPVMVEICTRAGCLLVKVRLMRVGRVNLLLMDSDVQGNNPEDRELTSRLYGGDNRTRIRQVILNLVNNARRFTEFGEVYLSARVSGQDVIISVRDTGPGIPLEIQSQLFQKFVTGGQQEHGSDLGLAFCKLAVEAHGQRIWVESKLGEVQDPFLRRALPDIPTEVRGSRFGVFLADRRTPAVDQTPGHVHLADRALAKVIDSLLKRLGTP